MKFKFWYFSLAFICLILSVIYSSEVFKIFFRVGEQYPYFKNIPSSNEIFYVISLKHPIYIIF